jgi:parallel beta-helix repeat protein
LDTEASADDKIEFRGNTFGAKEEVKITIDKTQEAATMNLFIIEVNGESMAGYPKKLDEESMDKEIKFVATYDTRLWARLPEVEDSQKKEWVFKSQDSTHFTSTPTSKKDIKSKNVPSVSDVYLGPNLLIGRWNGDKIEVEKPVPTTLDESHSVYFPDFGVFHNATAPGPEPGQPALANGVLVTDGGLGHFEKCEIHHAPRTGMAINTMGCPTVNDCKLFSNGLHGMSMEAEGRGSIERNDFFENRVNGLDISDGSNSVMRENKIFKNENIGACFHDNAKGIFELNKVYDSVVCGVEIKEGTKLAGFELWGGSSTLCPQTGDLANEIDRFNDYFVAKPKRHVPKPEKNYWKKNYGNDVKDFSEGYENSWGDKWEHNRPTGRTNGTFPPASAQEVRKPTAFTKKDKGPNVPVGINWGDDPQAPIFHKVPKGLPNELGLPSIYPDSEEIPQWAAQDNFEEDKEEEDTEENAEGAGDAEDAPGDAEDAPGGVENAPAQDEGTPPDAGAPAAPVQEET